jgi:hypothetical protein
LDSSGSGQGSVIGYCEHGNYASVSIQYGTGEALFVSGLGCALEGTEFESPLGQGFYHLQTSPNRLWSPHSPRSNEYRCSSPRSQRPERVAGHSSRSSAGVKLYTDSTLCHHGKTVKGTLYRPLGPRESRGITPPFRQSWREEGVEWLAPRPGRFTPGKELAPILQEAG